MQTVIVNCIRINSLHTLLLNSALKQKAVLSLMPSLHLHCS